MLKKSYLIFDTNLNTFDVESNVSIQVWARPLMIWSSLARKDHGPRMNFKFGLRLTRSPSFVLPKTLFDVRELSPWRSLCYAFDGPSPSPPYSPETWPSPIQSPLLLAPFSQLQLLEPSLLSPPVGLCSDVRIPCSSPFRSGLRRLLAATGLAGASRTRSGRTRSSSRAAITITGSSPSTSLKILRQPVKRWSRPTSKP